MKINLTQLRELVFDACEPGHNSSAMLVRIETVTALLDEIESLRAALGRIEDNPTVDSTGIGNADNWVTWAKRISREALKRHREKFEI